MVGGGIGFNKAFTTGFNQLGTFGGETEGLNTFTSDISDFLLGTNWYTQYYGMLTNDAAEENLLWKDTFNSINDETEVGNATVTTAAFTKVIDIDFDASMQAERIIGGKGRVNGTFKVNTRNTGNWCDTYAIVKIIRYNGTTETILGSSQSDTKRTSSSDNLASTNFDLIINADRVGFTSEDTLRITIELWAKKEASITNLQVQLIHNGTNFIEIPFARLDEY